MKKILLAGIILASMLGGAAYPVAQGLNVPGDLHVTGVSTMDSKLFAPLGIKANGSTVEAGYFIGDGSALSNVSVAYAPLSGTAEYSTDLKISGQAQGDILYFNGTNWVKLPAGTSGYRLQTAGPGADPYWAKSPWEVNGNTIEATVATSNLAFNSDTLLLLDSSRTKYLTWSSADGMFEFNDDVFINNAYGNFVGNGTDLTSLDASNVSQGILSLARGGTGNDTTAAQGAILYNDGSKWVPLAPGTAGYRLTTLGAGANPVWTPIAFGMHIDILNGLTGGPLTQLIGTVEVNYDNTTIGISGIGSLEVLNAPTADYAALAATASTAATVSNGAITASKFATGSVTSGAIALNTITSANMGTGSITQDAIAAGMPNSGYFLQWSGSTMQWANPGTLTGSLEVDHITINHNINGSLEVIPGGLDASRYATGSVTSGAIALNTITAANLANGSVTSGAIAPNTITAANLANGSVTSGAIALNTITAANMGTSSITKDAIAASNSPGTNQAIRWNGTALEWYTPSSLDPSTEVDNITIGNNTYGSHEVLDFGITTEKIADNAITPAKMATGSVTADAIANNAVYTNAIQNSAVTGSKIANTTIDGTKLTAGINISTTGYVTASAVSATNLYGNGSNITGVTAPTANYATLSGTASKAADLNITGQTQGSVLYFNGTNWVVLAPGNVDDDLKSEGPGANPTWEADVELFQQTGSTIEPVTVGADLKINSGAKFYLDNSYSKYLTWNQGSTRFEFNGNLYTSGTYYGNGSQLTSLNATNISSGILGAARGGIGSDTSAATQGSVLYNDGSKWVALAPSTSGEALLTQGPSANPVWGAPGSVTQVNTGRGLTGGPITSTGTLAIDTNTVVTTADAQILTNKTINSSAIGDGTTINTTGVATFGAGGAAIANGTILDVNGSAEFSTNVNVGVGTLDATNPELLKVDAGTSSSINVISGYGDLNNYLQLNIKNRNAGNTASSDLVATANNGDENNNYVDLGINGSGYSSPSYASGPDDTYLLGQGNDFWIGTGNTGTNLIFHTGGTLAGNERMRIDGSGNVAIGTTTPNATSKLTVNGGIKVTGAVTADTFAGNGSALTGITLAQGTITAAMMGTGSVTSDAILDGTIIGADLASNININTTGIVTATAFTGNGSGMTNITAISANYAALAGTATSASTATSANYAALAGTATSASSANYAALAGTATTASSANYATLAGTASTAATVSNGAITASKLATGSVTSDAILDGTIVAADIAGNTITAAKMATGSVTSDAILDGTIVAADLAGNTITAAKMATGSVTSDAILDGTIVDADINGSAAIAATKVSGTAETLNGNQIITGVNTFDANAFLKATRSLSLGDGTGVDGTIVVPFAMSGTVNSGDVVVLYTSANNTVAETTSAKDPNVVGIVQREEGTIAYVAVAGRVTATSTGNVAVGDAICTSTTAGKVQNYSALQTGKMIGIATESRTGSGTFRMLIFKY